MAILIDYGTSPSHTSRPILRPQVHQFSKATAKTYLQKTEPLWLKLDLSRQEGKTLVIIILTLNFP